MSGGLDTADLNWMFFCWLAYFVLLKVVFWRWGVCLVGLLLSLAFFWWESMILKQAVSRFQSLKP